MFYIHVYVVILVDFINNSKHLVELLVKKIPSQIELLSSRSGRNNDDSSARSLRSPTCLKPQMHWTLVRR